MILEKFYLYYYLTIHLNFQNQISKRTKSISKVEDQVSIKVKNNMKKTPILDGKILD